MGVGYIYTHMGTQNFGVLSLLAVTSTMITGNFWKGKEGEGIFCAFSWLLACGFFRFLEPTVFYTLQDCPCTLDALTILVHIILDIIIQPWSFPVANIPSTILALPLHSFLDYLHLQATFPTCLLGALFSPAASLRQQGTRRQG
ncbi:hypothetical protein QBC46DRAFT_152839 [Diplogelasinospora grovesii]|uniref:Uncharacterized protein n=1 Tax=Diplogelasinospora grovesii TaxID=303347 RepID=A0AAN6S2W4_9PEZI|nr:hypothetical protein QBC46DRAFT_152839 [Diplogelasinospora grovesii]